MAEHDVAPLGERHGVPNWEYADSAARLAATGFIPADVTKFARQLDDNSIWMLVDDSPVTWAAVSGSAAIPDDSVNNTKLSNMSQATIKGRASGAGTGDPTDLTGTQATAILDPMIGDSGAGGTKGLAPAPAAGDAAAGKFLNAGGTYSVPPGTGGGLTADGLSAPVYAADAGSTDAYSITLSPAPSAYTIGTHYRFKANTANTGPCTLNINSLGAKTIKKVAGGITTDLVDNDIRAGQFVDVVYDGTNLQMQSTLGNAPVGGGGVNPTDTVLPYNNAGTFADSHFTRTSSTVTTISAGALRGPNGSSSAPTFSFTNSAGTGLWSDNATTLRITANGGSQVQLIRDSSSRSRLLLNASGNGAMIGFGSDTSLDAGLYRPSQGHIAVTSDGADPTPASGTFYSPTSPLGTFGSELVVNMQLGNVREFVLNTNYTIRAPSNAKAGTLLLMRLKQDGTGSRTGTWNSAYKWIGGSAPALTTAANAVDLFLFYLDGTNAEELFRSMDVK